MPPKGSTKRARSRSPSTSKPASKSKPAAPSSPAPTSSTRKSSRARASTAEPPASSASNTRAAADNEPAARGRKRSRIGGTPGPGGSRPITLSSLTNQLKNSYVPKIGMNPLPKAVRPIRSIYFKNFNEAEVTAPHWNTKNGKTDGKSSAEDEEDPILTREMFVFGSGDMGQHGLGEDEIGEIKRPRQHTWIKEANQNGKLGKGGLEMVAAGGMHTLAIDSNGRVFSWGINDNAALGRRTDREYPEIAAEVYETEPMQVEGFSPSGEGILGGPKPSGGKTGEVDKFRATRIAAGDSVSVAVSDEGEVRVWGSFRSNEGLLGFDGQEGSDRLQYLPVALPALQKHSIAQVACGVDHVLALTTEGQVLSWGNGQQCQLGRRIIERRKINGLTPEKLSLKNIVLVGAGGYLSFAVDKDGKVFAWGLNSFDQTGLETDDEFIPFPQEVKSLHPKLHGGSKVIQIQVGGDHSTFLFDNGEVWVVGRCDGHELGLPEDHEEMVRIAKTRDEFIERRAREMIIENMEYEERMEAKRREREAKRKETGAAASQFENVISEGDVRPKEGARPQEIVSKVVRLPFCKPINPEANSNCLTKDGQLRIIALATGTRHTLAVGADGTLFSWGYGINCQLGQGEVDEVTVPTEIRSKQFKGYRAVASTSGGQHSVVLAVMDPDYEPEADSSV